MKAFEQYPFHEHLFFWKKVDKQGFYTNAGTKFEFGGTLLSHFTWFEFETNLN
jgi:hypothetical protein